MKIRNTYGGGCQDSERWCGIECGGPEVSVKRRPVWTGEGVDSVLAVGQAYRSFRDTHNFEYLGRKHQDEGTGE